ncbi:MAG: hypothetical protein ACI92W_002646 [Paraglaciecola sp.]|jgi:hypothetical protein
MNSLTFVWLLALLIPIIIHLFYFRRFKLIDFSNLSVLREIKTAQMKSRKFKKILLLINRLFFVLMLLVFFLNLLAGTSHKSSEANYIYVDNTSSMFLPIYSAQTKLDAIIDVARIVLAQIDVDQYYYFFEGGGIQSTRLYGDDLVKNISQLEESSNASSFSEVVNDLEVLDETSHLMYFSDFQKNGLQIADQVQSNHRITLVRIEDESYFNAYVDSVYLESLYVNPDGLSTLNVVIGISGSIIENDSLPVRFISDDQLIATELVSGLEKTQIVSIDIDLAQLNSRKLKIVLGDQRVTFDNTYFAILPKYVQPVVTYVSVDNRNRYIESIFSNNVLFDFKHFQLEDIDYQRISRSDFLIVDGFESIPSFLRNFEGSTVLLIPTNAISISSYNDYLETNIMLQSSEGLQMQILPNFELALFSNIFTEVDSRTNFPNGLSLYQPSSYEDGYLLNGFGQSFLSSQKISDQSVLFFGSPLELAYTSLPIHSLFVPLMYQLVFKSVQLDPRLSYLADERFLTFNVPLAKEPKALIINSAEITYSPNYRLTQGKLLVEFPPNFNVTGYFNLINGADTLASFAVNRAKSESELSFYSVEELETFAENNDQINLIALSDFSSSSIFEENGTAETAAKFMLLLTIIFLVSETLLARFL